jgi:hypothetical protein
MTLGPTRPRGGTRDVGSVSGATLDVSTIELESALRPLARLIARQVAAEDLTRRRPSGSLEADEPGR